MTVLQRRTVRRSVGAIFLIPAIVAAITGAGLLSALLGDDAWDWVSWLLLSIPIIVAAWYALVRGAKRIG